MRRAFLILAPMLVFGLAAVLGWLSGLAANALYGDLPVALDQLEHDILFNPPLLEIHNANGIEAALESDSRNAGMVHGDQSAVNYSSKWAARSPEGMFDWLVRQNEGCSFFAYILFGSWAEKDMAAALAAAPKIPDRTLRKQALLSSVEILCKSDPVRARELMIQDLSLFQPDGERLIFRSYDTGKSTCEMLLSLPPGKERTHLLAGLLANMGDRSYGDLPLYAISVWEKAPEALRRELVAAGFSSGKDNATSFTGLEDLMRERATVHADRASVQKFMEVQGPVWAKRDLAKALAWAQTHLKGKSRVEMSASLFEHAASGNFDSTLRTWKALPDGYMKARAAGAITRGAPADRKAEVEGIIQSLSEHDRQVAR